MGNSFKPKEVTLPVSWGKLRAQVWGSAKATRTVVALHGWLDNSNSFHPILKLAAAENSPLILDTRWICIDMAGHGKSDWRPKGLGYHFFDYIQDLMDVVQGLGIEKCHLVGHSLGAGVAAFFAGSFPERALSLSCLDSLGPLPFSASELPSHYREFRREWELLQTGRKKPPVIKTVSRAVAARLMAGALSPASAELLVTRNLKKAAGGWRWGTDARLKLPTAYRVSEEQVRAFLKSLQCRVVIAEASHGIIAAGASKQDRLTCIHTVTLVPIEGEHHVHMDHPERVLPILVEFLDN